MATDVTVEADVERLVRTAVAEFGRLDGAFNNVGGVAATGPVHTLTARDWHADLAQNPPEPPGRRWRLAGKPAGPIALLARGSDPPEPPGAPPTSPSPFTAWPASRQAPSRS